jgi:hypothetical protein
MPTPSVGMPESGMEQNELLNDVLIVMCRSLLQYAGQAWPWSTDGADALRNAVSELIAEQATRIEKLSSFLDSRGHIIDFGVFPDFTDLHYLAIGFVLPHVVENERAVVREIEAAQLRCADDAEGSALLAEILAGEKTTLARLEDLSRPTASVRAQSAA